MMNVAGEQAAERLRILARAAAAALVGEKANAVDVGKDAFGLCAVRDRRRCSLSLAVWRLTSWRT